jgi:hypothetical protein
MTINVGINGFAWGVWGVMAAPKLSAARCRQQPPDPPKKNDPGRGNA